MSESFPLDKQIRAINDCIEDANCDLKRARSPKMKKAAEESLDFFSSLKESLETLSVLQVESVLT